MDALAFIGCVFSAVCPGIAVLSRKMGGNRKTGSDAIYSYVKRQADLANDNFSCEQVRSFENIIQYLRQKPRRLLRYHYAFRGMASAGDLSQIANSQPQVQRRKQTIGERFEDLVNYTRQSRARDFREFMQWALEETDPQTRNVIVKEMYPRHDFEKLVGKALAMIVLEHGDYTWRESLQEIRPPITSNMSIDRSVECIESFFSKNGYDVYQEIDGIEQILDKKSTKVNAILFKGPTNTGKTLICNSIKNSFRSYADISQGIVNNFWLQPARNKRVIFHDECQWNEENQERIKKLTEGKPCSISLKGLPDEILPRTPYLGACNTWPWIRILQRAHVEAFKSRCKIFVVQENNWLKDFADKGDIDPRAWLTILDRRKDDLLLLECTEGIPDDVPSEKTASEEPLSYDGYYSDTTATSDLREMIEERYGHWPEDKKAEYFKYKRSFDEQHPPYHGQEIENSKWSTELCRYCRVDVVCILHAHQLFTVGNAASAIHIRVIGYNVIYKCIN